jgi:hypothetical protein
VIETMLIGRLGNWLFQYAAARALALEHGSGVVINISRRAEWEDPLARRATRALAAFRLDATFARAPERALPWLEALRVRERRVRFSETRWGYDPAFRALGPRTRLFGYFQSARYWAGHEDAVRADLQLRKPPDDPLWRGVAARIGDGNGVAVHVRRGDYLESALHNVCTPAYYDASLAELRARLERPSFFFFSDDVAWCRERYAASDVEVVDIPACREAPELDLHLMALARHHVISNSTLSWWGAYLGARGGIVLTPDRWFNDEAMNARAMADTVLPEWLRRPADGTPRAVAAA